jgi:hypothetical protein
MDGGYAGIAGKITDIKREEVCHPVHAHHSDKPGIVYLHARYGMSHDQAAPFRVNRWTVGQKSQEALYHPCLPIRLRYREPKAIRRCGTRADPPKLNHILWGKTQLFAALEQCAERRANRMMMGVAPL